MSKYLNKRTSGRASKRESSRADELALLQKIGAISDLEEQVKFELIPKQDGERAVTYTADFRYRPLDVRCYYPNHIGKDGRIVEDSKGFRTQQYVIRRKLMKWVHGITILET